MKLVKRFTKHKKEGHPMKLYTFRRAPGAADELGVGCAEKPGFLYPLECFGLHSMI